MRRDEVEFAFVCQKMIYKAKQHWYFTCNLAFKECFEIILLQKSAMKVCFWVVSGERSFLWMFIRIFSWKKNSNKHAAFDISYTFVRCGRGFESSSVKMTVEPWTCWSARVRRKRKTTAMSVLSALLLENLEKPETWNRQSAHYVPYRGVAEDFRGGLSQFFRAKKGGYELFKYLLGDAYFLWDSV